MKIKIQTHRSNHFGPPPAQTRAEVVHLRNQPQQQKHMKKLIAIIVLVCLWAATPFLRAQTIETYTFTTNRLVPDGNAAGLSDVRNINSAIAHITSLSVNFKLTGEFNGDLYVYLRHSTGYTVLLNRPGKTSGNAAGYADSGFDVTFQDGAANGNVHLYQNVTTPAAGSPLTGVWQPDGRTDDPTNVTDSVVEHDAIEQLQRPQRRRRMDALRFRCGNRRHQHGHRMVAANFRPSYSNADLGEPGGHHLRHGTGRNAIEHHSDLQLDQCARHLCLHAGQRRGIERRK